jgi:hypothetical protein
MQRFCTSLILPQWLKTVLLQRARTKKAFLARKAQYDSDHDSRLAARMHHAAYEDARAVFKHKHVNMTQKLIRQLFAEAGQSLTPSHRLVPKDPESTLQLGNVVLVSSEERKRLVKLFVETGGGAYKEALTVT